MKKHFLFPLLVIAIASCTSKKPQVTIIEGSIKNLNSEYALATSKGITDSIKINSDGTFSFTTEIAMPHYYTIRAGRVRQTVFLTPGKSTFISFDIEQPDNAPTFEGENSELNKAIIQNNQTFGKLTDDFYTLFGLSKHEFTTKLDSVKSVINEQTKPFEAKNKHFAQMEMARADYRLKELLFNYPNYHSRITNTEYEPNDDDYSFMAEVDLNNISHISINEYTSLVFNHLQNQYWKIISDDKNKGISEFEQNLMFYDLVDSLIENTTLRDLYKHNQTQETVKWASFEVAKNIGNHFSTVATANEYKQSVENALAKRMLLAPGQPAPEFTLNDINGESHSLSNFKGKLVYIDFWATWCSPCRAQIPHLKKMKDTYKGKPIVFIAISLDDDKNAWEKMVNDEQLGGVQLHADRAWLSDVAKQYQIFGVPTFVLVDAEGKIIEYPAPRPSDEATPLLIDKYLKQL